MTENRLITLLKPIADLLAPWLEITVFAADLQVLYCWHGLSAHKLDVGLVKKIESDPFIETLANGKKAKTLYIQTVDSELGKVTIRFRYDISWLATGFEEIKQFMAQLQSTIGLELQTWQATIEQQITQFLSSKKLSLGALTRLEKRELILALYEDGLLNYKDATMWLANRLNLSRATVYNHLNWAKSVRKIHIHQVDAFSEEPFKGNPAGVVLDADSLEEETMRSLTREMNNAETAFVLKSTKAALRMRYFTPQGHEMVFCGHSTVGALYMLAKEKRLSMHLPGSYDFMVETLAGPLKMGCDISKEGEIAVNFYAPKIQLESTEITQLTVANLLGLSIDKVNVKHKLYYEKTNKDLYITVNDLDVLGAIECDPKAVAKFCKTHDITVLCVLTPCTFSPQNQIHMRCFAPAVGIVEDLFTGSVIGGLIAYAYKNKIIGKTEGEIGIEQGHFLSRPGTVNVKYKVQKDEYQVQVFAKANHFFSTEIQLN